MKILAGLVGCGIGDALGFPFEMRRPEFDLLKNWDGSFVEGPNYRKYSKKGSYSDDTIASIALAKSLIECKEYNPENAASKYLDWYKSGEFRGMGSTTSHALSRLKLGMSWKESGMVGEEFAGNGGLMKILPLSVAYSKNLDKLIENSIIDCSITHNNKEAKLGSVAVALAGYWAINNSDQDKKEALPTIISIIKQLGSSKVLENLEKAQSLLNLEPTLALEKIGTTGYSVHTAAAAIYCFCKANSFKETVMMAIKAGGDTDTTGAVAGALAGIWYGLENIPQEYKDGVENYDLLLKLDKELTELVVN